MLQNVQKHKNTLLIICSGNYFCHQIYSIVKYNIFICRCSDVRYIAPVPCMFVRSTALKAWATIMFILKLHTNKSINNLFLANSTSRISIQTTDLMLPGRCDPHPLLHVLYAICPSTNGSALSPEKPIYFCHIRVTWSVHIDELF